MFGAVTNNSNLAKRTKRQKSARDSAMDKLVGDLGSVCDHEKVVDDGGSSGDFALQLGTDQGRRASIIEHGT